MVKLNWTLLLLGGGVVRALSLPEPIVTAEETSLLLRDGSSAADLAIRDTDTPLKSICKAVATNSGTILTAAAVGVTGWMAVLAQLSYLELKKQNKCALMEGNTPNKGPGGTYGTVYYHIQPSGGDCSSTALEKTFLTAFTAAGNVLHDEKATAGCCSFQHGDGTWHSNVKVKTGEAFLWSDIVCPTES